MEAPGERPGSWALSHLGTLHELFYWRYTVPEQDNLFQLTKTPETWDIEICECGSRWWVLDKSHFDLHGYAIKCAKCGHFLRWTGKKGEKTKNPRFAARHKAQSNGERICDFCGITESEAKLCGAHFQTDHRQAERFGGEDNFENTRPLCSRCHYLKNSLENMTAGLRKVMEKPSGN